MTTTTDSHTTARTDVPATLWAVLGIGVSIVLTAVGTFWDLTDNEAGSSDSFVEFLPIIGFILVAAALVFGLVVRTADERNGGRRAIILSVLAVLTVLVAWTGLPAVLAAGAVVCALRSRGTAAAVALGLSVLALVGAIAFAIAG